MHTRYLDKAKQNRIVAQYCEDNEYYNVAIGRFYYYFFLVSKYNLIKSWDKKEKDFKSRQEPTHIRIRSMLRDIFNDPSWQEQISVEEMNDVLIYFEDLCDLRVRSEYTEQGFDKNQYQSTCLGIVRKLDKLFKLIRFEV